MSGIVGGNAGRSSGIVKAAGVADDSVTLAKMAGGTDGNIISYDASGDPVAIATGTDGQVLTSTGAGSPPAFETAAGGGIGEFTPSGGTSIAIDSADTVLQNESGTSNYNIGIGLNALEDCTTSGSNIAIGQHCLKTLTSSGSLNIGVGFNCLALASSGAYNTIVGSYAGPAMISGSYNTGVGASALYAGTTGSNNTACGNNGLLNMTTGSNNTGLGDYPQSSSATVSNEITLGNSSVSGLRCQVTSISSLSDERDKAEITDLPEEAGLDLINSLRPRTFYWDMREWYDDGVTDGSKIKRTNHSWKSNSGMRQGFIAQEVDDAISGIKCLEDSKVVSGTEDKKELAPAHLLTNAIKAIQQLSAENKLLIARIEILENA